MSNTERMETWFIPVTIMDESVYEAQIAETWTMDELESIEPAGPLYCDGVPVLWEDYPEIRSKMIQRVYRNSLKNIH